MVILFIPILLIIIILLLREFFTPALAAGFLLEFDGMQISWTLLSIMGDLNDAVVCMVLLLSNSFRVFHISVSWWFLLEFEWQQVSRTCLKILAVLSNAVFWIVSICPPTSKSSRPFNNPLVIVPKAPITIGTIVTFMFYSFFNSLVRSRYLFFFSLSFRFILWFAGTATSTILQILLLLLLLLSLLLFELELN